MVSGFELTKLQAIELLTVVTGALPRVVSTACATRIRLRDAGVITLNSATGLPSLSGARVSPTLESYAKKLEKSGIVFLEYPLEKA